MRLDRRHSPRAALTFIVLGLLVLAQPLTHLHLGLLWTAAFFIPAALGFLKAGQLFWRGGAVTVQVVALLLPSLIGTLLGLTFLLNWPWSVSGAALLVLLGLSWLAGPRR